MYSVDEVRTGNERKHVQLDTRCKGGCFDYSSSLRSLPFKSATGSAYKLAMNILGAVPGLSMKEAHTKTGTSNWYHRSCMHMVMSVHSFECGIWKIDP